MKKAFAILIFLMGFAALGQVSAEGQNQNASPRNTKSMTLASAIDWIENNSQYVFVYSDDVDLSSTVTISTERRAIDQTVTEMFRGTEISCIRSERQIILCRKKSSSSSTVSPVFTVEGTVLETSGEFVPGAFVTVVGKPGSATIADENGNFSISVELNDVLCAECLGYKKNCVLVTDKDKVSIVLEPDSQLLDEIVIVGYGTQNKKTMTGAVSTVDMDGVEMNTISSVSSALAGKAAGLRVVQNSAKPGGGFSYNIRGAGSTGAGNAPLFIIDGFPVSSTGSLGSGSIYDAGSTDNDLSSLNPDDIESITVLKDASSTSIYGARAGHGVILITTKRGSAGKAKVTYSGSVSVQEARTNYKMLSTSAYMDMRNKQEYEEYLKAYGLGIYSGYIQTPGEVPVFAPRYSNDEIYRAEGTDWLSAVMRTGFQHQHSLSVSGGSGATRYLASVNYMNQEGVVKNNDFGRFSARINLDQDFSEKVKGGITASFSQNSYNNVPLGNSSNEYSGVLTSAIEYNPTSPIYNNDGSYYIDPFRSTVPNPVSLLEIEDKTRLERLLATAFLTYSPVSSVLLKAQLGADKTNQKRSNYIPTNTLEGNRTQGAGYITQQDRVSYLMELTAQYENRFGDHYVKGLAGYSFQRFEAEGISAGNKNFLTDAFSYHNLGYGSYSKPTVGSSASISSMGSYFFRLNYSYADRYMLETSIRADGASNFTKENRWGFFPSISAGWAVSEEPFMAGVKNWMNFLKVRASYGQTGNSNVGYRVNDYYAVNADGTVMGDKLATAVFAAGLGNPNLTWETTSEFNLGLDVGLWQNRLKVSFEYYNRVISDLLVSSKPLLSYNEVSSIADNQGSTQSQGLELTISTINFTTRNFEWTTNLTLSHYEDRWLDRGKDWIKQPYQKENDPIRAWWSYEAIGIMQPGDRAPAAQLDLLPGMVILKDQDGDGLINQNDYVYMDNGDPKIIYGLQNNFRYRNFDFSAYFCGEAGRKSSGSYYEQWTRMDGGRNVSEFSYKAFNSNNLSSTIPTILRGGDGWGDYFVKSIYYIRCAKLTFGYTLPLKERTVRSCRFYADLANPFVITNWKGLDPETDNGTYPYPNITSMSLGVSVSF